MLGDTCLDEYFYGTCDRLNPEAPVPILNITRRESKLGMAANMRDNLEAFGCAVDFMSGSTRSTKQRYIDERSKQHIVRVDDDIISEPCNPHLESLQLSQYSAIVISDYNKGYMTYSNIVALRDLYSGPIFLDTKKHDLAKFEGFIIKINSHEFNQLTSKPSKNTNLIVTHGDKGAVWGDKHFNAPKVEVVDVCGAGDTFLAALAYQYLLTGMIDIATEFAIKCSTITVQHRGVYSLTQADIDIII